MAGITTWQSKDALARARRRAKGGAIALGVLAALWLTAFFGDVDGDTILGGVILELFTLIPMIFLLLRLRNVTGLIRKMNAIDAGEQQADSEELRSVDETLTRTERLVKQLSPGPAQRAANESLGAAERAARALRRLLERQHDLEGLIALTRSAKAKASLKATLAAAQRDATGFQTDMEELAAAIAALVDAADDAPLSDELARVRAAGERADALSASLDELTAATSPPRALPTT